MIALTIEAVKKILTFHSIELRRYKTLCGKTNFRTIWIDPFKDILPTFLHECVHIINEEEIDEDAIEEEVGKFCETLTNDEVKTILRFIVFKI